MRWAVLVFFVARIAQEELIDYRCEVHGDSLTVVICLAPNIHSQVIGGLQLKGCGAPFRHDVHALHFDAPEDGFWDRYHRGREDFEKLLREYSGHSTTPAGPPLLVIWPEI